MANKSRLRTANNSRRRLWTLLLLLLFIVATTGLYFTYEKQLNNIVSILQETFPAQKTASASVRGTIYDRNFKELAQTLERVSLYIRPREVKDVPETARVLSEILSLPESELLDKMGRDAHLVWLRRDIGQEDENAVEQLALPGVYLHREFARSYPMQEYASHVIGNSENDLGLSGVEHYYNRLLNQDHVQHDDFPAIDLKGLELTRSNGHDLVLTLDMKIQAILEAHVASLSKNDSGRITSLLLDVRQGKIIASVTSPSYNLNNVWQNEEEILDTLLLTPMLVPEEIRRFFSDAASLQNGWELGVQVYPWSLAADTVSISTELRLWDRLQMTTDSSVDFFVAKDNVVDLQQYTACQPVIAFGTVPQTASPLKVLLGATHLLNGGKKIQPHVLDRIMERPNQKNYLYDAFQGQSTGKNVFPALVSSELRRQLKKQGPVGALGSVTLSGKTVSLVKDESNESYSRYVTDKMSLVVIPADKPELILLFASREEELQPGFKPIPLSKKIDSILPGMVALQQINQGLADVLEITDSGDHNFKNEGKALVSTEDTLSGMLKKHIRFMPDLQGFSLRKSLRLLQRTGMNVTVTGTGRIVMQSPKPGKIIKKGEECTLILKSDVSSDVLKQNRSNIQKSD